MIAQGGEPTNQQMKVALQTLEKKLNEAYLHLQAVEEKNCRLETALVAVQGELDEARRQISFLEQRCKLMEEIDRRVSICI